MVGLYVLGGYLLCSFVLYFLMKAKCKKNPLFKMPKSRAVYYLLSFTWGLPMALLGCAVAGVLFLFGKKPVKYGWNFCIEFKGLNSGTELGIFFIAPEGEYTALKNHEHGHGIQNIYLGVFSPAVVSIPSFLRFWYRRFKSRVLKKKNKTAYDDIWFEGSATYSGNVFMERYEKSEEKQNRT